jgi:hypothetical protein
MASKQVVRIFRANPKKSRPGVISKTKTSRNKQSKNYKKKYRGQGR